MAEAPLDLLELCASALADDPKTAMKAVQKLKAFDDPLVEDCLIRALEHADENVRGIAAYALKDKGSAKAIPPLLVLLQRDDSTYLSHTGSMTALGYLTTIVDDPEIVQQYLDTVRTLLRSHDNYTVRGYSTQLLRDSLGEDALPDLIVALDDEDHHVRGRALNYIGELWKETPSEERRAQIREAAERMIKDPHASCRLRAAQVLEGIGDEAAIAVLLDAIPDRDEETHNTIIDILNRFNPNQSG